MPWQLVAEGSLDTLQLLIADKELQKGTRIQVVFDLKLPLGGLFNVGGIEAFRALVPPETEIIDVWGEGNKAWVELEVDPPLSVAAVLAFIAAYWVQIAIAGTLLAYFVYMARVSILTPTPEGFGELIIPIVIIGGLLLLGIASRDRSQSRKTSPISS